MFNLYLISKLKAHIVTNLDFFVPNSTRKVFLHPVIPHSTQPSIRLVLGSSLPVEDEVGPPVITDNRFISRKSLITELIYIVFGSWVIIIWFSDTN